ncbi:MAG: Gfo/Idh/MocA family protein [Planctomycetota bacterium]|jgi:predicted dehydrogenase
MQPKSNTKTTRRTFLSTIGKGTLAVAAGGLAVRPRKSHASLSRNEKIVVGLIGTGWIGKHHLKYLKRRNDVEVAAVCDVFIPRYIEGIKRVGGNCQGYQDFRHVLDRKDIDAIWCATPDHWHPLIAIHACQAGKDVYVEKPLSTTLQEGRKIVETARRYGRIVQVGTQQRSMDVFRQAIDIVHSGKLGHISTARCWAGPNGDIGPEKPSDPPQGLDWDMWLGPAPWVPYSRQRFGAFRSFKDYTGGELTDWGTHLIDIARWGIREESPLGIQALGSSHKGLTACEYRTAEVIYEFKGCTMTWSQAPHQLHAGRDYGIMFQGQHGRLIVERQSFLVEPAKLGIPETKVPEEFEEYFVTVAEHHDNFLNCIRTRTLPHSDIEIGHRSTSVCLLGNIAIDLQRRLLWDGRTERFINDPPANRHLYRPYRAPWHL